MERFGLVDWVAKDAFKTLNQLLWDVIKFLLRWELKHLKILAIRFDWLAKWWVKTWNRLESLHHRCQMGSSDDQECDDGKRKKNSNNRRTSCACKFYALAPFSIIALAVWDVCGYYWEKHIFWNNECFMWKSVGDIFACNVHSIRLVEWIFSCFPVFHSHTMFHSLSLSLSGSMCVCFFLNRICFVCRTDVLVAFNLMSSSVFISKRKPE